MHVVHNDVLYHLSSKSIFDLKKKNDNFFDLVEIIVSSNSFRKVVFVENRFWQ